MARPLHGKAVQQVKTTALDFIDHDIILHLQGQRGGEETASSSWPPPLLAIFSSIHDDFPAVVLPMSWALPCSSSSHLLTPGQGRKGKISRTPCIFAGLQLLHTVDLEAVDGIPFIHSPVDSNGGAGGWVWLLRYDSRCLWDWEENLPLLYMLLCYQPNYLQIHESTQLLIFTLVHSLTKQVQQEIVLEILYT